MLSGIPLLDSVTRPHACLYIYMKPVSSKYVMRIQPETVRAEVMLSLTNDAALDLYPNGILMVKPLNDS